MKHSCIFTLIFKANQNFLRNSFNKDLSVCINEDRRERKRETKIHGFKERGVLIHNVSISFSKQEDIFLMCSNSLRFE